MKLVIRMESLVRMLKGLPSEKLLNQRTFVKVTRPSKADGICLFVYSSFYPSLSRVKVASIYYVRTEGVKKYLKFADKQNINFAGRGGGVQRIWVFVDILNETLYMEAP